MNLGKIAKAITAAFIGAAVAYTSGLAAGSTNWALIIGSAVVAFVGVWAVPNASSTPSSGVTGVVGKG